jgi:hypothetical protein
MPAGWWSLSIYFELNFWKKSSFQVAAIFKLGQLAMSLTVADGLIPAIRLNSKNPAKVGKLTFNFARSSRSLPGPKASKQSAKWGCQFS